MCKPSENARFYRWTGSISESKLFQIGQLLSGRPDLRCQHACFAAAHARNSLVVTVARDLPLRGKLDYKLGTAVRTFYTVKLP